MKKTLAVCVLLLLSLLVAWWWKGTGEDPRLLRTIDVRTIGDFGAMLSVNPDGSKFASGIGNGENELIIWDSGGFPWRRIATKENSLVDIQSTKRSNYGMVTGIVFHPDWDEFVWWRQENDHLTALGIWRFGGMDDMFSLLPQFTGVYSVAVGPRDKRIAFHGFNDETKKLEICVYWPERWEDNSSGGRSPIKSKLITLEGVPERDNIRRMAFSPDGSRLLGIGLSHDIFMWDLADQRLAFTIKNAAGESQRWGNDTLAFSPDSKRFALVEDGRKVIRIRSSIDGSIEKELPNKRGEIIVGFSPDGKWYAGNYVPINEINLHSVEDGRVVHTFKGPEGPGGQFIDVAFSGDSRRMVTSSYDRTYRIWDLTDLASP